MFKRLMILIAFGVACIALAIVQWNISITIPTFGIVTAAQLLVITMSCIIGILAVTIFAGLISCG